MKNKRLEILGITPDKCIDLVVYLSDMEIDNEIEIHTDYNYLNTPDLYYVMIECTDKIKSFNISMDDEEITIHIESKKYDTLFSLKYNEYISITL